MTPPRRWLAFASVVPFAALVWMHARYYLPFISDDALISLRYAARLLDGHGLTWTDGPRVEGYSNLLWVLLTAAVGSLGVELVTAARALGIACTVAMMLALAWRVRTAEPRHSVWLPTAFGLAFLALSAPVAVWAIGGLEQPLYGALLAGSIALTLRLLEGERPNNRVGWLSLLLGLLCLTRPDGPVFTAVTAIVLWLVPRSDGARVARRTVAKVVLLPVVLTTAQVAFRLLYYGEWVPNTALVKMPRSAQRWVEGFAYVEAGLHLLAPLSHVALASIVALLVVRATRGRGVYLMALAVVWCAYVSSIGGDIFPAYRHMVPTIVIFAFAIAEGVGLAATLLRTRRVVFHVVAALALLSFVPFTQRQFTDKHSIRAKRERWEWDGQKLGLLLKQVFHRQQPLVAVTAAGAIPYWSELPSLDMLGLNDEYLPRHPPPDIGRGSLGHELGDGAYVMRRSPDIIIFNIGSGPHYRAGEELERTREFHERYVPAVVRVDGIPDPVIVYFDKYSRAGIGIRRHATTLNLPPYLFTGEKTTRYLIAPGKLVLGVQPGAEARLSFEWDEPLGGWSVDTRASAVHALRTNLSVSGRRATVVLTVVGEAPVEIEEIVLRAPAR